MIAPEPRPVSELADLQAAASPFAASEARAQVRRSLQGPVKVAVIDDDSTGTQTVAGIPLLTSWETSELEWAMRSPSPMFGVLANSRALPQDAAVEIFRQIGERLRALAGQLNVSLRIVSRSDSCMRGHFPQEPDALAGPDTPVLICPAFPQAGRVTFEDIHWVRRDDMLVGAAQTEYAADPMFGYKSSNLIEWVRERAGAGADVESLTLADVRSGPKHLAIRLGALSQRSRFVIANAVSDDDLDCLAAAADSVHRADLPLIYRSGPSLLSSLLGRRAATALGDDIAMPGQRGLLVVGSHTQLTTAQLNAARREHDFQVVDLDVVDVLAGEDSRRDAITRACEKLCVALRDRNTDAALVTSRVAVHGGAGAESLRAAQTVADTVVEITEHVAREADPRWLVAKGGITSHDLAVRALHARRVQVLGPLFDGQISVWELGDESLIPGLRYVVFPGNVGGEQHLSVALHRLKGTR
jgi:uncharacterized protein YgbK (DUF1537 family)